MTSSSQTLLTPPDETLRIVGQSTMVGSSTPAGTRPADPRRRWVAPGRGIPGSHLKLLLRRSFRPPSFQCLAYEHPESDPFSVFGCEGTPWYRRRTRSEIAHFGRAPVCHQSCGAATTPIGIRWAAGTGGRGLDLSAWVSDHRYRTVCARCCRSVGEARPGKKAGELVSRDPRRYPCYPGHSHSGVWRRSLCGCGHVNWANSCCLSWARRRKDWTRHNICAGQSAEGATPRREWWASHGRSHRLRSSSSSPQEGEMKFLIDECLSPALVELLMQFE